MAGRLQAPITPREFEVAVRKTLKDSRIPYARIGLAISGGVDSMALAYLWHRMTEKSSQHFEALIVDHNVRPESKREAIATQHMLSKMSKDSDGGFRSKVLTLKWPPGARSENAPNFESVARTLRYQVFGQRSFRRDIEALLVAHHMDDRAETVLARLADRHRGAGLATMRPSAQMPECRGIFGVYQSGRFESEGHDPVTQNYVGGPEEGGVGIYRPLLDFPKSRLLATCKAAGVEWIEDKTNRDPTLTTRNAVRKLLSEGRLPKALQRGSLIRFSEHIRQSLTNQEELTRRLCHECRMSIDLRSGVLTVTVPPAEILLGGSFSNWSREWRVRILAHFLRTLGQCVSAHETMALDPLSNVVEQILARVLADSVSEGSKGPEFRLPERTEAGGVIFEVIGRLTGRQQFTQLRMYRRPYPVEEVPRSVYFPPVLPTQESTQMHLMSAFKLWDGRFWIQIRNTSLRTVSVVAASWHLLNKFKAALPRRKQRQLKTLLDAAAPGKARWTLPAIVVPKPLNNDDGRVKGGVQWTLPVDVAPALLKEDEERTRHGNASTLGENRGNVVKENKRGVIRLSGITTREDGDMFTKEERDEAEVVALPTLGIVLEGWQTKLSWDIRYKRIDLQGLERAKWPNLADYPHILAKEANTSPKPIESGAALDS